MGSRIAAIGVVWIALFAAGLGLTSCTPEVPKGCAEVAREPNISPDYSGTTIPPNIAPLNFRVLEPGRNYVVKVHAERGQPFTLASRMGDVRIPVRPWQDLLAANKGGPGSSPSPFASSPWSP